MTSSRNYVGLVHHPVYNKHQEIVTTSITNIDVHDISRVCCTFGISKYLLINPLGSQHRLYSKIANFWQSKVGKEYQPDRAEALEKIVFLKTCDEARDYIKNQEDAHPIIITTTAKQRNNQLDYDAFSSVVGYDRPILFLFGTGYGLAEEIHDKADYVLKPIESNTSYNHLSVRSAVAIVLDRLIPKNKGGVNGLTSNGKQRADSN